MKSEKWWREQRERRRLIADLADALLRTGRDDLVDAVLDERMTLHEALAAARAGKGAT